MDPVATLRERFGYPAFRSGQEELVRAVLAGRDALGILRTAPGELAAPESRITVTFDRPVAGGIEELVDAATLIRVDPAVPGKAEWRDPVTLRFTPDAPLRPGTRYEVTVANTFAFEIS
jgi:hypothetical protein